MRFAMTSLRVSIAHGSKDHSLTKKRRRKPFAMAKRSRKDLTMTQKMDVVKALDEKKTQNEIAKEFGISQTQVSRIKKNKDRI